MLNCAYLASNLAGTNLADESLAISTDNSLKANPYYTGRTATEIAQIRNFPATGVPEPATWMTRLLGCAAYARGGQPGWCRTSSLRGRLAMG